MGVRRHQRGRHHVRGAGAPRHQRRIARPRQRRRDSTPQADQRRPVGSHPGGRRRHDPGHGQGHAPRCGCLPRQNPAADSRGGLCDGLGDLDPGLPDLPACATQRDPYGQVPRQIRPEPRGEHRLDGVTEPTPKADEGEVRGHALALHIAPPPPMADPAPTTAWTRPAHRFTGGPPGIIGWLPRRDVWYAAHARVQAGCVSAKTERSPLFLSPFRGFGHLGSQWVCRFPAETATCFVTIRHEASRG